MAHLQMPFVSRSALFAFGCGCLLATAESPDPAVARQAAKSVIISPGGLTTSLGEEVSSSMLALSDAKETSSKAAEREVSSQRELPSIADMVLFGSGCCRFDNYKTTSKGYISEEQCMRACVDDRRCVAAGVGKPDGDTWDCSIFHGSARHFRTACAGQKERCFKKEYSKAVINYPGREFAGTSKDFEELSIKGNSMLGGANGLSVAFTARWDGLNPWSRVIDFGNGPNKDNIVIANKGTSGTLMFSPAPGAFSVEAVGAIAVGKTHRYLCTVNRDGYMRIFQDGKVLAESSHGKAPEHVERKLLYVAKSNFGSDAMFDGRITDLYVWNSVVTWNDVLPKFPCSDYNGCPIETHVKRKKVAKMSLFGRGCCRFDDWAVKRQGSMTKAMCKQNCLDDEKCIAADLSTPQADKWDCYTYQGLGGNFKTECPSSTGTCFRKEYGAYCKGAQVDSCDVHTCCDPRSLCGEYRCPGSHVPKSSEVRCTGSTADSCNTHTCCDPKFACSKFTGCNEETHTLQRDLFCAGKESASCNQGLCCKLRTVRRRRGTCRRRRLTRRRLGCGRRRANPGDPPKTDGGGDGDADDGDDDDADGGEKGTEPPEDTTPDEDDGGTDEKDDTDGGDKEPDDGAKDEKPVDDAADVDEFVLDVHDHDFTIDEPGAPNDGPKGVGIASAGWHRRRRAVSADVRDKWLAQANASHSTPFEDGESLTFTEL